MNVSLVPKELVPEIWPKLKSFMEKAAFYTDGRYVSEDILDLILDYNYPLWVAFEEKTIKGAVVTRFNIYPQKKYLSMEFCAGEDGQSWKDEMLSILRKWAVDNNCDGIEALGRLGWKKIFEKDGYKKPVESFEIEL